VFETLPLETPAALRTIAELLAAIGPVPAGRRIVFAGPSGWEEDVKAEWAVALRRLNERRNLTIRECPNAIVLAGPSWFPWLAHDEAPDLWSVRTAVFAFPGIAPARDKSPTLEPSDWRSGLPMAHELQPPEYYEELAAALEGSRRPGEQETRGRLLLRASAAWQLHGEYDNALRAATNARDAFEDAHKELMVAVTMGKIADILQQRGETDEALRILREEVLPVFERLGDVRARAVTMSRIALILYQKGELEEVFAVLGEAAAAFEQLKMANEAAQVRGLQKIIVEVKGSPSERRTAEENRDQLST